MAKISEVLHLAADWHLWDGITPSGQDAFSCVAVESAWIAISDEYEQIVEIERGLEAMGCPVTSAYAFKEFTPGPERQAARYSWLKFAALIAEEQGQ